MGAIWSALRQEKTTETKLELLEEKIKKIEQYAVNTQERKKRFVGTFLAVAVGIYVIAAIAILYFVYFPVTWKERIIYLVPLLISPYIIILLRRLFTWYFERKLNKNSATLTKLRAEKKAILEQVMDKETYKVAVNLLTRFADKSGNNRLSMGASPRPFIPSPSNQQLALRPQPNARNLTPLKPSNELAKTSQNIAAITQVRADQQLRRRTPFPIINQAEKSIFERCLDILIGDGPQDRFAVICNTCHSHNGMALKEEFDYITYRCAFCQAMNPARKTRPIGPRLPLGPGPTDIGTPRSALRSGDSSNSTTEASDDEVDLERNKRRVQLRLSESTGNQTNVSDVTLCVNTDNTTTTVPTTEIKAVPVIAPNEVIEPMSSKNNLYSEEPMDNVEQDPVKAENVVTENAKKMN